MSDDISGASNGCFEGLIPFFVIFGENFEAVRCFLDIRLDDSELLTNMAIVSFHLYIINK